MNKEGKAYKNKLSYINEYNKKYIKTVSFKWSRSKDADLIEYVEKQPLKAEFFRRLVREEMKKNKK